MSDKPLINSAHQPGNTCIVFSRDGSHVYTGGTDTLVRIWRTDLGADQEPDVAMDADEAVTTVSTGRDSWFSGSTDAEVRRYGHGKQDLEGLVTSGNGVAIRCVAADPKGDRIAVTSDEPVAKVVDIEDTTNVVLLKGHTKAVRKATWHPSGSLLTTSGADGKIIVWDVSEGQAKEEKVIEGVIPVVANSESSEFSHDCSAVWHPSGHYFVVATRAHEIAIISRNDWTKSSTFSDESSSGAITALALSKNGVYLASASKSGIFIWSTQTRRLLFRYQGALTAQVTQLAFSPSQNLLAWTDADGVLTRWPKPIPSSSPDPVKPAPVSSGVGVQKKRSKTPTLFDDEADGKGNTGVDLDEDLGDLDNDDWILDDLGGGLKDEDDEQKFAAKDGVREMVSVTKAQPAFQPGSTPMENKKRYLAYNTIGVIEVTDQDTHHIVNVEFHDKSARKGYHFTDHFKYDLASLGERGAAYACQPENEHPAHVLYKSYGTWATQSEWTYELPKGTRILGIAAGAPPPTKSFRERSDVDLQGSGNVIVATSQNELIFLTGTGVERMCLTFQGDFVSMIAGPEWVFLVHRDGSTTLDGSQNLTGRLIKFDDFCVLQKDTLPIPKRHTLVWLGITEEGAPAIYDSSGILNVLPRFRVPFGATWTRLLDTNTLDRREGKQESYWPIGISGETFMCLILKGQQECPGFPRPLIQELSIKLPFHRTDPKEAPLEEHWARESMLLDILRDGLGDELTTDDISRRELALDKEIIQLIQNACKHDRLARALDLARLLHHTASFDMATKVAGFYHLVGLQEKVEALKEDREGGDRLAEAREKRKHRARDLAPVPAARPSYVEPPRQRAFQDSRPPPVVHRPGLERATPAVDSFRTTATTTQFTQASSSALESSYLEESMDTSSYSSPDGKRKRAEDDREVADTENVSKRRAIAERGAEVRAPALQPKGNPFARKAGGDRNPFAKSADANRSVQKSESFFNKIDAAETEKSSRSSAKGKSKEKKGAAKQTTLFGLPPVSSPEKKVTGRKKKTAGSSETQTQDTEDAEPESLAEGETQDSTDPEPTPQAETQDTVHEPSSVAMEQTRMNTPEADEEPIDWAPSPRRDVLIADVEVAAD